MTEPARAPGFAPFDPTDGRKLLDWRSNYSDPEAKNGIRLEAVYLSLILAAIPVGMLIVWLDYPRLWFGIPEARYPTFARFAFSWLSGTLGGTLFSLKWLYHSVARQIWHLDRRLWRMLTPHISGGLSFSVAALVASGLVSVFDNKAVESLPLLVGAGFLVGYFSDSAIAKLSEVAETLFGSTRRKGTDGEPKVPGSSEAR